MKLRVTEWKENERISLQMISGAGLKAYEQCWSLEPTTTGSRFKFMEILYSPSGLSAS